MCVPVLPSPGDATRVSCPSGGHLQSAPTLDSLALTWFGTG
jgi:hypothetical protein